MSNPQSPSNTWHRVRPYALLAAAALLFFFPLVLHPTQVLYSDYSDLFAEHIPAKIFVVRSWQETGELPLWCPYLFSGEPIVADLQVAMFYPFHQLFMFLPEDWLAPGLSWLIVLHVMFAGWFMFAYARSQGLGEAGSLMAAFGYMFSAKWFFHLLTAGHYITLGMTWIPLILLFLDLAVRKRCLLAATGAGCSFALLVLCTHPQWILYGGVLVAAWSLGPALEQAGLFDGTGTISPPRTRAAVARWLGFGIFAAVLAVALAAIQLLPTYEMSKYTSRQLGMASSDAITGGLRALLNLAGPALQYRLDTVNAMWEDRSGLGVWWLAAAVCAPWLASKKLVRFQAGVGLALLIFAVGGSWFFEFLPGFKYFRQPSRMMVIVAFPAAYLAGATTDAIWKGLTREGWERGQFILSRVAVFALMCRLGDLGIHWLEHQRGGVLEEFHFHPYWPALVVTVGAVCWLFGCAQERPRQQAAWVWCAVLVLDLLALSWPQVDVRPLAEVFPGSQTLKFLVQNREPRSRVFDRDRIMVYRDRSGEVVFNKWATPLGAGAPLAPICRLEAVRGYNPLDVLRYKEYLQFLGGTDEPLRGLGGTLVYPVLSNFPVFADKRLCDLLGIRYYLWPKDEPLMLARPAAVMQASDVLTAWLLTCNYPAGNGALIATTKLLGEEALVTQQFGLKKVFEDPSPATYNFLWGGMCTTRPYLIFENPDAMPRAFVVPHAVPLAGRADVLPQMLATDFRECVLLEDWPAGAAGTGGAAFRPIQIKEYLPNRVTLDLAGGPGGHLVLADIWYPGWNCTIDGSPVEIHRANFLFRGVELPDGAREAVLTFAPPAYHTGKWVTWGAMGFVVLIALVEGLRRRNQKT